MADVTRFQLNQSTYSDLEKLAVDPCTSFVNGTATNAFFNAVGTAGSLYAPVSLGIDITSEIQESISLEIAETITYNVITYATGRISTELASLVMPPTLSDIIGESSKLVSSYVTSASDMLKELSQSSEDFMENASTDAITDKIKSVTGDLNKYLEKANSAVSKVQSWVTSYTGALCAYMTAGAEYIENAGDKIQQSAIDEIGGIINESVEKASNLKSKLVSSLATAIAQKTASVTNAATQKKVKKQLDTVNMNKEKATIKAKAAVGKALLNLWATLGL